METITETKRPILIMRAENYGAVFSLEDGELIESTLESDGVSFDPDQGSICDHRGSNPEFVAALWRALFALEAEGEGNE